MCEQCAEGFMACCLGVLEYCVILCQKEVREAATLAQGHTAGQCPRPSRDPGLPDSKDVYGSGGRAGEVLGMVQSRS